MPGAFIGRKKIKALTTTVYSLAAIDKETYLLLQCTVNVTRRVSKIGAECLCFAKEDLTTISPSSSPESRARKFSASTGSISYQLNPQTSPGRIKEEKTDQHLWKPITTMKVPLEYNAAEKVCITGDRNPELLKKLSKKHFETQSVIRQTSNVMQSMSTRLQSMQILIESSSPLMQEVSKSLAEAVAIFQTRCAPGEMLSNGIMSVAYLGNYLYAIGIVIGGKATELVRRIEVFREDGRKPAYVWEEVPSLPNRCPYHASFATDIGSDKILVVGGDSSSNRLFELYLSKSPLAVEWKEKLDRGDIDQTRKKHRLINTPACLFVLGGVDKNDHPILYCQKGLNFDNHDENWPWQTMHPLKHAKASFVALYHDGYIYAIGGRNRRDKVTLTMERCKGGRLIEEDWKRLNIFQTDGQRLLGCVIDNNICVLGGKPKTFDLKSSDDVGSITWNLSPTIDLPTIYFENAASTIAQVKTNY